MGEKLFDKYSQLHFLWGIIAYNLGISSNNWFILHTLFEIIENSPLGMFIINHYFTLWPGGKQNPDTLLNMFGDTLFTMLGWYTAKLL